MWKTRAFNLFISGIIIGLGILNPINSLSNTKNHTRQYFIYHEVRVNSPNFLFNELQKRLIPDADILTCIAVAESGYDLSQRIGKNNIFGITNICFIHYNFTNVKGKLGQEYVDFDTMEDQLRFIEQWIYKNPRMFNENKVSYIYRTGYNPYPAYYQLLTTLYKEQIWKKNN